MRHIIEVSKTEVIGVAVKSVQFSHQVRLAICQTAKGLLTELNPFDLKEYTMLGFANLYSKIKDVYTIFNEEVHTPAKDIRNAIRVLDLRIQHCSDSLKQGEWKETYVSSHHLEGITEKTAMSFVKKSEGELISEHYIGSTMELMLATRQILVYSLITITSDFE
jgi:hypothetical protein